MRFGFVTCVQLGLACMEEIYRVGGQLELAVTLRDDVSRSKSGRVYLDNFCNKYGIPLIKICHVNDPEAVERIKEARIDWLFIIGWSQIAGPEVLSAPRQGVLGMHPTLLPEGRGRAAIPWAILKGLPRTGVTLFKLDEGVDTGPILGREILPVSAEETATSLYARVVDAHRHLLANLWKNLASGNISSAPQDESRATVWPGRSPEDGRICEEMSVEYVDRLVRATTHPYPGAFIDLAHLGRVRIWSGRPAASAPPAKSLRLRLSNGEYDAHEYEIEAWP